MKGPIKSLSIIMALSLPQLPLAADIVNRSSEPAKTSPDTTEEVTMVYSRINYDQVSRSAYVGDFSGVTDDGSLEFTPPADTGPDGFAAINPIDPSGPSGYTVTEQGTTAFNWMAAYIDYQLQDHVVGYAYVINGDGQPKEWNAAGYAKTPQDGDLEMSVHTRSFLASVTKHITSVATVKILHEAGLTIDTPIAGYLPAGWKLGKNVSGIRFRHLLTHATGWGQLWNTLSDAEQEDWNNGWDGLKYVVSLDLAPGSFNYSYKNANTALLRILIPQIWVQMGGAPYTEVTASNHDLMYLSYVQHNIFNPIGIYSVSCSMQASYDEALAYSFDHVETGGVEHSIDLGSGCGGHSGLRLSAVELAKYLAYLRYSDQIISLSELGLINSEELGWDDATDGKYTKSGAWFSTTSVNINSKDGGLFLDLPLKLNTEYEYRKSSRACIAMMPNGVEASLVINSEFEGGGEGFSTCGILRDAFDFASN
ncbi:MAG: serine hydrolase [Candidatus Thiodiazotropha sp.]